MGNSITAPVGASGHKATLTVTNLDGSPATNATVSYDSDATQVCTVDPSSGVLTLVAPGTATITGNAQRDGFSHSDTATVTVTDPNTGDFSVSLNLA